MSAIYSPEEGPDFSSPACLATMTKSPVLKHRHLLTIDSEIEYHGSNKKSSKKGPKRDKKSSKKLAKGKAKLNGSSERKYDEVADDAAAAEETYTNVPLTESLKYQVRVNGKEEFPEEIREVRELKLLSHNQSLSGSREDIPMHHTKSSRSKSHSIVEVHSTASTPRSTPRRGIQRFFTYRNKSESPVPVTATEPAPIIKISKVRSFETSFTQPRECEFKAALDSSLPLDFSAVILNCNRPVMVDRNYATLPRVKKSHFHPSILYSRDTNRTPFKVPKRTTADGTNIYYWCNVPKSKIKGDKFCFDNF